MAPVVRGDEHEQVHPQDVEEERRPHLLAPKHHLGHYENEPLQGGHLPQFPLPFRPAKLAEGVDAGLVPLLQRLKVEVAVVHRRSADATSLHP
eukprot:CAMPEP_0183308372 /NCGR_PEP_ID=MMETSP0160_2-20130417/21599_1 /TAXON_ID=2839 ORGANISM="Odontella Sinensis, Strain Grunow 1884" /NCGR_SAMPLE_ID=MMETSP0160_2 /ASSEMBLY_ACC=CAM_ASM_000250 /LENGTH=92 /DNA_ID=CAMNT_0025472209 /DNA_START=231 /DNA_END=505 /DNA_ORIENTATION=+